MWGKKILKIINAGDCTTTVNERLQTNKTLIFQHFQSTYKKESLPPQPKKLNAGDSTCVLTYPKI